jgi:hypothetical protein
MMQAQWDYGDYWLSIDQKELEMFQSRVLTQHTLEAPILPWNGNVRLPRNDLMARLALILMADDAPDGIELLRKSPGDIDVKIGTGAYRALCATGHIAAFYDDADEIHLQTERPPAKLL